MLPHEVCGRRSKVDDEWLQLWDPGNLHCLATRKFWSQKIERSVLSWSSRYGNSEQYLNQDSYLVSQYTWLKLFVLLRLMTLTARSITRYLDNSVNLCILETK